MHFLRRGIFALTLLALLCLGAGEGAAQETVPPESVGLSAQRLGRLDAVMEEALGKGRLGGAVLVVARRGQVAYFKAFGNADAGRAMRTDAIFRIASMTKPLTAVAVMLLYEEGRLLLSDPVSKYIPEFRDAKVLEVRPPGTSPAYRLVPAKRPVTIRDLLSHTSGLSYSFLANWFPDPRHTHIAELYREGGVSDGLSESDGGVGEMVKTLARLPLIAQPGEAFEYGLSFDVLGYLVEVVSGMTLEEFMQRRIFQPLKMNDTSFVVPPSKVGRVAGIWEAEGGRLEPLGDAPRVDRYLEFTGALPPQGKSYYSGGAGLFSTAGDYLRFCQMLLNKGELDGVRLLSRKTVDLMTGTNQIGPLEETILHGRGWKYGLGFAIEADRGNDVDGGSVGCYEWAGIFSTRFNVDPSEQKITIFMSQTQPFANHIPLWDKITALSSAAVAD